MARKKVNKSNLNTLIFSPTPLVHNPGERMCVSFAMLYQKGLQLSTVHSKRTNNCIWGLPQYAAHYRERVWAQPLSTLV